MKLGKDAPKQAFFTILFAGLGAALGSWVFSEIKQKYHVGFAGDALPESLVPCIQGCLDSAAGGGGPSHEGGGPREHHWAGKHPGGGQGGQGGEHHGGGRGGGGGGGGTSGRQSWGRGDFGGGGGGGGFASTRTMTHSMFPASQLQGAMMEDAMNQRYNLVAPPEMMGGRGGGGRQGPSWGGFEIDEGYGGEF